ncbi:MAG: HD domain-containing protein [Patescibacteria group bacterium]|nr:HD domain-containing protein [Patescibacteria group bacterium]
MLLERGTDASTKEIPISLVDLAKTVVKRWYSGALRDDGTTPVYTHLEETARNIEEVFRINNDPNLVVAAWLHDVIEDGKANEKTLIRLFGEEVTKLVMAVSKFRLGNSREDSVRIYFEKLLKEGSLDIRVLILKMADHFHNSQTLGAIRDTEKRFRKAEESLRVYGLGLAEALGMWEIRNRICDNAFEVFNPSEFSRISCLVDSDPRLNESFVRQMEIYFQSLFGNDCCVKIIRGGIWHIYDKARRRRLGEISDIGDVASCHLIFPDIGNEEERIEFLHRMVGRLAASKLGVFIDESRNNFYVGPKKSDSGYEAMQTTLIMEQGAVEIVFETKSVHERNMWGAVYDLRNGLSQRNIVMFLDTENRIWFLPPGSKGLDFVYKYDPQMLGKNFEIRVNNQIVSSDQPLENAQVVEVSILDEERVDPYPKEILDKVGFGTRKCLMEVNRRIDDKNKQKLGFNKVRNFLIENRIGVIDLTDLPEHLLNQILNHLSISTIFDLYHDIGSGAKNLEELAFSLQDLGVTKERLGYSSVGVFGRNRQGILFALSGVISEFGGDIIKIKSNVFSDESFVLLLVVRGVDLYQEAKLFEKIRLLPILEDSQVVLV